MVIFHQYGLILILDNPLGSDSCTSRHVAFWVSLYEKPNKSWFFFDSTLETQSGLGEGTGTQFTYWTRLLGGHVADENLNICLGS